MVPLARLSDPKMLALSNLEYDSPATVLFQRASVSATGLVLAAAAWYATRGPEGSKPRAQLLFFLLVANSGLLLVDHIHFQYNGILLGESGHPSSRLKAREAGTVRPQAAEGTV
jgi:alpha-1,3-glucosyltransferase